MKTSTVRIMQYNAWANFELISCLEAAQPRMDVAPALQVLQHYTSIAHVFSIRLSPSKNIHPCEDVPSLAKLSRAVSQCDDWYLAYTSRLASEDFAESISFRFLDGNMGCMTRGEILMHVALHSSLHRGEIYGMLRGSGTVLPWDTYAVFLHRAEPARRSAVL